MSAPDLSCFDYIVGLYPGDCQCYTGRPSDFDESFSGQYISDLFEPKMINGLLNCDQGASIWELMEIVRALAIRNFIADANALLMKSAKLKRIPYKGGLGRASWTKNLTLPAGEYVGVRMRAADVRSGFLKIKKVGLCASANCATNLLVYDTNGTLISTIALTGVQDHNSITTLATPLELPLHDEYLDFLEYFFILQPVGFSVKNNELTCNCEHHRPLWGGWGEYKKHLWAQWLQVGGWHDSVLPDFMNINTSGLNYMYGLTFDIELGCKINEVFCKDSLDFDSNTLAQAMAIAIKKESGALFVDKILTTTNLNRDIMSDREGLAAFKQEWKASYVEMITYIVSNLDLTANDCLECRDIIEMIKGGIMA